MRLNIKKPEYEQKQFMLSPETQMVGVKNPLIDEESQKQKIKFSKSNTSNSIQ